MRRHIVRSMQIPTDPSASQAVAVQAERTVYVSGQVASEPSADLATQTRQVLERIKLVLEAAGLGLDELHQVTLYVTDLADLASIDEVYGAAFLRPPPARSVVQVAALPDGARVMLAGVAGG